MTSSLSAAARARTTLSCHMLEDRCMPAQLNLTAVGASGVLNGAIFEQAAGTEPISSFLRIRNDGTEQGYNTDARPVQFDTRPNPAVTHALELADVPVVERGGVSYREFVLDVNQRNGDPQISLEKVQIFVGDGPSLTGYRNGKLAGQTAVYDMDAGDNNWVRLNARRGNADGDMRLLVPDAAFGGANYVYLFSRFGDHHNANGGAEEWGVRPMVSDPPPLQLGTISGTVYADFNTPGVQDSEDVGLENRFVFLDTNNNGMFDEGVDPSAETDANGNYSFSNLPAGPGNTYTVVFDFTMTGDDPTTDDLVTISLTPGQVTVVDFGALPMD